MKVVTFTPNPAIDCFVKLEEPLQPERISRCTLNYEKAGGKGINISAVLNNFSVRNIALFVQGGADGLLLQSMMKQERFSFSSFKNGNPTRRCYLIEAAGSRYKINNPAPELSSDHSYMELADWVMLHVRRGDLLHIAGSPLANFDLSFYAYCMQRAIEKEVRVSLDLSGKYIAPLLQYHPEFIKMNLAEFKELSSEVTDDNIEALIASYFKSGEVIISMGAQGAYLAAENHIYRSCISRKFPKLAVGAGDTMLAIYIKHRLSGENAEQSFLVANVAAVAAAHLPIYEHLTPNDIKDFAESVSVKEL